jgi:D-inositol-3-phosphate glycosyltransferase
MGDIPSAIRVTQGLYFFPRGGSAQVVKYLVTALSSHNVHSDVVSGSLGDQGESTHAGTFFDPLSVAAVDYTAAVQAGTQGADVLQEKVPLHPSYEDRIDVPDRIFTSVEPAIAEYHEQRWASILADAVQNPPDIFHMHHLTPMQVAARANWPDTPLIGHLHGTELKMLKGIRDRCAIISKLGLDLERDADRLAELIPVRLDELDESLREVAAKTRWSYWRYAQYWEARLRHYAGLCDRLIVLTPEGREQAADLLGYDSARIHPVSNGVDISRFEPDHPSPTERLAQWRRWLVEEPRGWDESGQPGSVRYTSEQVDEWFLDASGEQTPVLFYVGRFTNMKRVPLLIRAYHRAQSQFRWRAPLVIWGGNPGEWEDEHPVTVARELDVDGVFFVGWRGHDELPAGLNASDVMVAPSTNEPFGQVYLEAMACEIPVIATRSGGPLSFINQKPDEPDGWLIPADDESALANALIDAVNDPDERKQRGRSALKTVRSGYSWSEVARQVRDIYDDILRTR